MKVVISGYIGKKITGIGRNLICLLDNATSDNEYIIYTNEDMKDNLKFQNPHVIVKTYSISKMSSVKNLLWTTFIFPSIVRKENADRALIPNFTLLLFKHRPTTVIMHDLIEFNVPNKFSPKKMFYRTKIADPITAQKADKIITVSENSKRDIMKFLGVKDEKITVVYNGVDQEKFHRMNEEKTAKIFCEKGWPTNFLLFAGFIEHPGKNTIGVIKAYEELKKSGRYDGHLILAGMPGSGFEVVKSYTDGSTYKDDIFFTGYVTDEELIALYSKCATFVFISLYEGFGIPPLEAMSCGAKVVVSNTSSLPEVVGDIGITVDPKDQDAVNEAVYKSLVMKVNDEYEEKVKEHLKKYNWNNLSKKFENALKE